MTGNRTHEQNQRIINKQENTKGADVPTPGETLEHARKRYPGPAPAQYDNSTGDRSISRGDTQEDRHHKERADDQGD